MLDIKYRKTQNLILYEILHISNDGWLPADVDDKAVVSDATWVVRDMMASLLN